MNGTVDQYGRALVAIQLKKPGDRGRFLKFKAWIDTGFTGELVLPKSIVEELDLPHANVIKAELGDGSLTVFDTNNCVLKWFDELIEIEALESSGDFPLVGVSLLKGHEVLIDYDRNRVRVV